MKYDSLLNRDFMGHLQIFNTAQIHVASTYHYFIFQLFLLKRSVNLDFAGAHCSEREREREIEMCCFPSFLKTWGIFLQNFDVANSKKFRIPVVGNPSEHRKKGPWLFRVYNKGLHCPCLLGGL